MSNVTLHKLNEVLRLRVELQRWGVHKQTSGQGVVFGRDSEDSGQKRSSRCGLCYRHRTSLAHIGQANKTNRAKVSRHLIRQRVAGLITRRAVGQILFLAVQYQRLERIPGARFGVACMQCDGAVLAAKLLPVHDLARENAGHFFDGEFCNPVAGVNDHGQTVQANHMLCAR